MNIDKDKNNADLADLLRKLPKKRDQMEVIKVLNGLQGLDRISGREVLDYVRGYIDVKKEDPDFEFKDYAEMAQFGSKNTIDGIMAKPGPKAPAKPAAINRADLDSISIQLGLSELLTPAKEPSLEVRVEADLEAETLPPSKKPTIEMPPAQLPTRNPLATGTVTKHLTSQYRYAPTSNKDMGGGMGSVIPYKDKALDREVIRKKPKIVDDDGEPMVLEKLTDALAVFEREMRISGSLVHANIPPVYEAGIDKRDGTPYFDMLKIVGKPLNDVIELVKKDRRKTAEAKEYTLQRRVQIFADICRAMVYSHSQKIIHRDLKPGNVMIGDNKVTYVIDWGLAKHLDDKEDVKLGGKAKSQKELIDRAASKEEVYKTLDDGLIKGTISYMAPEQAMAEGIDEKSDQYTLGTILYELATLEDFRPYLAKAAMEKVVMIGLGKYPFVKPRKIRPETPAELESIILKATQFDKRKRYQSVNHMLKDVEAYLTGGYVSAHDYGFVESWAKRVRNNPIKTVAGGLAAIALAGIVSVYGVMSGRVAYNQLIAAEADAKANKESNARELAEKDAKVKSAEAEVATQKQKAAESDAKRKEAELALAKEREKGQNIAQNIVNDGDRLIKDKGDFEGAIAKYSDAIRESKGTWNEPFYKRGLAKYSLIRASDAIEDFIEANRVSEEKTRVADVRALYYAGLVNLDLLDRLKPGPKKLQFPAAVDFLKQVTEKAPDKTSGYFKLAQSVVAFTESRFDEAYQLAQEAESQNPKMWEAKCLLAQYEMEWIPNPFNNPGMRKHRNYKRALERLEDALESEKDQIRCMILKPQILLALGWDKEALIESEKLIRIRSDVPQFHYFKGLAHQHLGEDEKALAAFANADRLDTPLINQGSSIKHEICTYRGLVYFSQKNYDAAEKELDEAIRSNEWAQAYSYRGVVRSMKKNFEGAIEDHNKALELQPDFAQGYSNRGRTYRYMGQTENAIKDYKTSIQKGYEVARLEIGEYFVSINRNQEAAAELEKYLANPDNRQQRDLAQRLLDKAKGK